MTVLVSSRFKSEHLGMVQCGQSTVGFSMSFPLPLTHSTPTVSWDPLT